MNDRIHEIQIEIMKLKQKLAKEIADRAPEPVEDWGLTNLDGSPVKLSELFGDKSELLVIHNMGRGCHYCSLWGDAMIGIADHLRQRCGFVLCSNDPPEVVKEFRELRGWSYPCVSGNGSGFAKAMGYMDDKGSPEPGVSAFHKDADGSIVRTGHANFGPGDDFCGVWPMLDLLRGGIGGWEPAHGKVEACCAGTGAAGSSCGCS
jgi:predicted dithiol-disulfide oxidoreductase (DUF899 family)